MLKISILDNTNSKDFDDLLYLFKKFIVDIYIRNKPEYIGLKGNKKNELVNKAFYEFENKKDLSILNMQDVDLIQKRIQYQINLANNIVSNPLQNMHETRYYILKDDDNVVAFQQAQLLKTADSYIGSRYIAYTDHNYALLGKQKIIDSNGNIQYDTCSECLYSEITKWFNENNVKREKTSTGKYMLPNISTYILHKGFLPRNKDHRNVFFEKDMSQEISKSTLKKIYKLYVSNLSRTTEKNVIDIIEEIENTSEFSELTQQQKYGIIRSILIGQESLVDVPFTKISDLNSFIQKNIDNMSPHINYNHLYNIAYKMISEIKIPLRPDCINETITAEKSKDIVLNFFKYIDNDLYIKAHSIIKEIDNNFTYKETIEDVYELVSKVSNKSCWNFNCNSQSNYLFRQIPLSCFEFMLGNYLVNNSIVSEKNIVNVEKMRTITYLKHSVEALGKLELMRLKKQNVEITTYELEKIQKKYKLSNSEFSAIIDRIYNTSETVDIDASFLLAQLVLPQYVKLYQKNPQNAFHHLKEYIENANKNNMKGIFKKLGIDSSEDINTLISDNKKRIASQNKRLSLGSYRN